MQYPKGSEWRLWDLHVHTPLSVLSNGFPDDWDDYVKGLFKKAIQLEISAIGITDYYTVDGYKKLKTEYLNNRTKMEELFSDDEIAKIERILVVPNIEFRINKLVIGKEVDPSWNRRVNFHLILSDKVEIEDIEQNLLHNLKFEYEGVSDGSSQESTLTHRNLIQLGQSLKEHQPEFSGYSDLQVGMLNASVDDKQLIEVLAENNKLFKGNYLTAIYADEDLSRVSWTSQGHLTRKVLIHKSHLIFSSNKGTIDFALGKKHASQEDFKKEFKTLKPCIWSSDAHSLGKLFEPDDDRFTWIKSDPTFEGLKHVIYEPEDRVKIQKNKPEEKTPYLVIDKARFVVESPNALFSPEWIEINPNLNTIIGGKSSGKSLLLYHLAKTISPQMVAEKMQLAPLNDNYELFIRDNPFDVEVLWQNGNSSLLSDQKEDEYQITFIPQLYINQLVEERGEKHLSELVEEILEQNEVYVDYSEEKQTSIAQCKTTVNSAIDSLLSLREEARDIQAEIKKIGDLRSIKQEIERLKKVIEDLRKESGFSEEDNRQYLRLAQRKSNLENRKRNLSDFGGKLKLVKDGIEEILDETKAAISELISDQNSLERENLIFDSIEKDVEADIGGLQMKYENQLSIYEGKNTRILGAIDLAIADTIQMLEPYNKKVKNQELLKKETKELQVQQKKEKDILVYKDQLKTIFEKGKRVNDVIISKYEAMFNCYKEIRDELNSDKFRKISDDIELQTILEFDHISFKSFSNSFDGRTRFNTVFYSAFNDDNEFSYDEARHISNIRLVFDNLRNLNQSEIRVKQEYTTEHLYKSLLSDCFKFKYVIKHKGDDILRGMSPGKRGVVLLELILHLSNATHPILIDQPEDNLDNRTIYDDLRGYIKEKKIQRQIIIVTHNANMVVATDAENVIVANQDGQQPGKDNRAFRFEYVSGALENTFFKPEEAGILYQHGIKEHVCDILEGGQEAFEKREEKYGFK